MPIVMMYATHGCRFCQQALAWLAEHPELAHAVDVQFVDADATAREAFQARGFRGVPTFVMETESWSGWDPARLTRLLEAQVANSQ